jgi:hypothetical protein
LVRGHAYSTNWLNTTIRKFCQELFERLAEQGARSMAVEKNTIENKTVSGARKE